MRVSRSLCFERLLTSLSLLVLAWGLFSAPAWGDWPPISPQDLSMSALPEQPGAPAVVLLREEIDDDMNAAHSVYQRIKILTDAGRRYGSVELPYSRRGFSITGISGRTVEPDGSVVPFDGKVIDKTVVKANQIRMNVKSFSLPDVQVGSIIDYRYQLRYRDNLAVAPEWEIQTDLFQRKAYFKFIPFQNHGNVEIRLPHGEISRGIAWSRFLAADAPQPQLHQLPNGGGVHDVGSWVDLNLTDIPALVEEPFMPPINVIRMRVYFYYQQNTQLDDYWKSEGKYWNKDVERFVGKDKGIREALFKIISPSDTPEQKVRKIYAFVASLENQDYMPERSEQERKTLDLGENKGAEDVLAHQNGTHDELNRMFVAMVRAAGLPASLIWVPDRSHDVFMKQYMSTQQFAAEVAIVQLDGKDVFLDPGTKFCPYGVVDWRYSGVAGLRQSSTGADFGQTATSNYQQSIATRLARLSLDEQGSVSGTVTLMFKGIPAMHRRQEAARTDSVGRQKMLEEELRKVLPGDSEVALTNTPDWTNSESPLTAQFHVSFPYATLAGKRLMLAQHVFQVNQEPRFSASRRTNVVYFHVPWQEADEVYIKLPPGFEVESLAPDDSVKLPYALYQARHKQEAPDTIFSRRDFIMAQGIFTTNEYKQIKDFFDKVKADDDQPALVRFAQHAATAN